MGGLGNQMFQYAAARALAIRLNTPLKIDISYLLDRSPKQDFTHRDYELSCFNIQSDIINAKELTFFLMSYEILSKIKITTINRICFNNRIPICKKFLYDGLQFNKAFCTVSKNTLLEGYWQSEKYFHAYSKEIRNDFTFLSEPSGRNKEILSLIRKTNAISVHIRRGDYANNAHTNSFHGLCDKDYYIKALEYIADKINDPVLFFFSDDMDWVKLTFDSNSQKYDSYFLDHTPKDKNFEDMLLMSQCKHNIIANSSFSWWGAWLNETPEKIVIVPKNWFANPDINTKDLIPEKWIRI